MIKCLDKVVPKDYYPTYRSLRIQRNHIWTSPTYILASHLQYQKVHCFLSQLFIFIFFLFLLPSANSISFNFFSFNSNVVNITFQGDAHSLPEGLQLTRDSGYENNTYSVCRALYQEQVHLWDNSTGWLAVFETQFSFNIKSIHEVFGDGLSFFIAPFGSDIPENSAGGYFGLISSGTPSTFNESSKNNFVAVEFDTYKNWWDPSDSHVGINVNSINSSITFSQVNFRPAASALVRYKSTTKNLSVLTSSAENLDLNWNYILSFIDLRTVLPEWVSVGFSAATVEFNQSHTILSWSFNSSLREEGIHGNTLPNKKNVLVLGIGFAVGLVAVMSCGLVLLWFICWRKNIQYFLGHSILA
ncbi:LOW QUALITY PROTEIN: anti-H(O) lectin 1-like [Quercus suber]|uniref:LOW QUALITY PROTEIN: anti-H(O) lectin 1-like n=1 Tax=Quercus suber TaxID=58331 RepID=UPI0032DE575C